MLVYVVKVAIVKRVHCVFVVVVVVVMYTSTQRYIDLDATRFGRTFARAIKCYGILMVRVCLYVTMLTVDTSACV